MRIVLVGPPGAGKGTQATLLSQRLKVPHISTGEMIRAAIASGSELGLRVKAINDRGELVSDELMREIVLNRLSLSDCESGFVLDGYPRTVGQVAHFDSTLKALSTHLDHVLEFKVPRDVLLARVQGRAASAAVTASAVVETPRADDKAEIAKRRLDVYESQTAPLIGLLKQRGIVREVPGTGSVEEVAERVLVALGIAR